MLFEADSVVSGYGALEVLHGVSLSIEEGEIVSVLGANGAGKTTFLRTVSGVLDTWEGKITLEGADLGPLTTERRAMAGLGHLPEGRGIFQNLTFRENLDIGLGLRKDGAGEIRRDRDRLLDLLPAHRIHAPGASAFRAQQMAGRHCRSGLMGLAPPLIISRGLGELPSLSFRLYCTSAAVVLRNGAILQRRGEARLALEAYQPLGADQPLRLVHEVGRALVLVAVVRDG